MDTAWVRLRKDNLGHSNVGYDERVIGRKYVVPRGYVIKGYKIRTPV